MNTNALVRHRKLPLILLGALLAMPATLVVGSPTLADFSALIANPADGGAGPGLWLSTSGLINTGSDSASLATFSMDEARDDFFGNAGQAFALRSAATGGAGVSGSMESPYLSGGNASLVMTFRTPAGFDANAALIGRRPGPSVAGQPKFEVYILAGGSLRLTTGDSQFGDSTIIGALAADTWYYLAVTWDVGLPLNQARWYLGKMDGGPLSSGAIDGVTVAGSPDSAIYVAGRPNSDLFFGSFQNIAMYARTLSASAIEEQFALFGDSPIDPPPPNADLATFNELIATPVDGGSGPTLWFQSARTPNFGSAGQQWEIGAGSPLIDVRPDYFGNAAGAFGLPTGFDRGAAISGSGGQNFASGEQGTVILSLQTTGDVQSLASIFSKGVFADTNPFEITLFQGNLRLNYRLDAETKTAANIYAAQPDTWYTMLVRWDMALGADAMRWFVIDMDRGIADAGNVSPSIVGDVTRAVRVAGRPSSNPFFGSLQNIAVYDRALGEDALLEFVSLFRGENPFLETVEAALPGAFWVGPDDLYSHPAIGRFRTGEGFLPKLDHAYFGELSLVEGTLQPPVFLHSEALDFPGCATPFGWLILDPETWPYVYRPASDSWLYIPNIAPDGGYFWAYDFSAATWVAFGCR
jgi:hypothetical protein